MIRYIGKRLLMMIPILLGISFIVLILIDISPGDVARIIVGSDAEEWEYEKVRDELKLDDPLPLRYVRFIAGAVQGDFGKSFITKKDVWGDMMQRFPYT
jgi:peptide/nickel transport system permease protein